MLFPFVKMAGKCGVLTHLEGGYLSINLMYGYFDF